MWCFSKYFFNRSGRKLFQSLEFQVNLSDVHPWIFLHKQRTVGYHFLFVGSVVDCDLTRIVSIPVFEPTIAARVGAPKNTREWICFQVQFVQLDSLSIRSSRPQYNVQTALPLIAPAGARPTQNLQQTSAFRCIALL